MSGAPGKTPGKTPGKMSKRQSSAVMDNGIDDDPPLKRPREDDKRAYNSPCLSKLGGLNGLNRKHEKPDELFRKDLISAMKLADTEQLEPDMYVTIADPWKQDWERGVQVPVAQTLNKTVVRRVKRREVRREKPENLKYQGDYAFKLPVKKMLYACRDENFQSAIHELHETHKLAEQVCRYDLDNVDVAWLRRLNELRTLTGEGDVEEWVMEKIMEELETQCYNNMQTKIKTVEGLGIEYDENVVCDVCRSPDSEDGNEMVFCDACDICVHQACYGVGSIPPGNWLCRSCAIGVTPHCMLCPKLGGAMKSTKNGSKWAHVACALWIPEINIGDPEKMEPITRVKHIPASRWSLVCSICRVKEGACIQCAVKTCKTAFHVTCAFSNNLDMKTILDDNEDDVQLRAFCSKHSKKTTEPARTSTGDTPKKESEMTEEEKTELRSHRLQKLAEEFYTCVTSEEVAQALQEIVKQDVDMVDFVKNYWVLKRKANFNKPLLTPKTEEADLLSKQREDSLIARMKMFIHLRQDLERVRNLCYMVSRREKTRRLLFQTKELIFRKQVEVVEGSEGALSDIEPGSQMHRAIVEAHRLHRDDSVYDQYDDILLAARLMEQRARRADQRAARNNRRAITEDSSSSSDSSEDTEDVAGTSARNYGKDDTDSEDEEEEMMEDDEILAVRRPSLDSSEDEGELVEQSVEQMKEQKNRKLASVRMSKLLRDRKENDRRKKQAEAEEAAKKAAIERAAAKKAAMDKAAAARALEMEKEVKIEVEAESKTDVKSEELAKQGRNKKQSALTPKIDDKSTEKSTEKPDKIDSEVKKVPVKIPGKVGRPRKRPLSGDINRTVEKSVVSPKPLVDTDDKTSEKRTMQTPDKVLEKKEPKSSTGRPRGRPRKSIAPEDKDKTPSSEPPPMKRRRLSEKFDDKEDTNMEVESEKITSETSSVSATKTEKENTESKSEIVKKSEKEKDDKENKRRRVEKEDAEKDTKRSQKEETPRKDHCERSEIKKKEEARGRKSRTADSPDRLKSKSSEKSSSNSHRSRRESEVKLKKDSELSKSEKSESPKKESDTHKTKDLEKKLDDNLKRDKPRNRDSRSKDEHSRESESHRHSRTKGSRDERRRSNRDVLEEVKKEDKKRPTRESSEDTIIEDHSPDTKSRRSLRSATPVCPSDGVSVRSSTPVSDISGKPEEKDMDEVDNVSKKSRSRRTSKVSPSDSNHSDTKHDRNATKKLTLEPTVELSRLRHSDINKVKDESPKDTVHNLRVKDQNRPSPKSFKEPKLHGSVQVKQFTFLKQSLVVPAHIRRKVANGFKNSRFDRLQDSTQKKISSFFKANGADKKENEPVPGNDRLLLSPAALSVSPRSYSPRGSNIPHPEPGSTPDLRSVRRQIHNDLDVLDPMESSNSSGSDRRLRSRDATPEQEASRTHHRRPDDFNRRVTERNLAQKLNIEDPGLDSEVDSVDMSDTDSEPGRRRRSSRRSSARPLPVDLTDDESRHSTTSTSSRYSMRSQKQHDGAAAKSSAAAS